MTSISRCLLLPSLLLLVANAGTAAEYQIIDLGPLEGGVGSAAFGVNDHGIVVGESFVNMYGNIANSRPVRWSAAGEVDKLWESDAALCWWDDALGGFICNQTPQYAGGAPRDINNHGSIVGQSQSNPYDGTPLPTTGVPDGLAFFRDEAGRKRDLGTLGGLNSMAAALNDVGQVVGTAQDAVGAPRAFVWDAVGGIRDLGTLGGTFSFGNAINASGQVAGYAANSAGQERAFLWDPVNGMTDLGTLGGDGAYSRALAINNTGQVVGTSSSLTHGGAFLWDPVEGMTSLNTDPAVPFGDAYAINNIGVAVGTGGGLGPSAIVWDAMHGPRDLQSLVPAGEWDLEVAFAINDVGQIVGYGLRDGSLRAFIAVPVPEPASLVLLACGALVTFVQVACRRSYVPRFIQKGVYDGEVDSSRRSGRSGHPFLAVMVPLHGGCGLAWSGRVCAD